MNDHCECFSFGGPITLLYISNTVVIPRSPVSNVGRFPSVTSLISATLVQIEPAQDSCVAQRYIYTRVESHRSFKLDGCGNLVGSAPLCCTILLRISFVCSMRAAVHRAKHGHFFAFAHALACFSQVLGGVHPSPRTSVLIGLVENPPLSLQQ